MNSYRYIIFNDKFIPNPNFFISVSGNFPCNFRIPFFLTSALCTFYTSMRSNFSFVPPGACDTDWHYYVVGYIPSWILNRLTSGNLTAFLISNDFLKNHWNIIRGYYKSRRKMPFFVDDCIYENITNIIEKLFPPLSFIVIYWYLFFSWKWFLMVPFGSGLYCWVLWEQTF